MDYEALKLQINFNQDIFKAIDKISRQILNLILEMKAFQKHSSSIHIDYRKTLTTLLKKLAVTIKC